eukprot:15462115-Alexandrium_andersonii.AAC.1
MVARAFLERGQLLAARSVLRVVREHAGPPRRGLLIAAVSSLRQENIAHRGIVSGARAPEEERA